jgi:hypothetical protein
MSQLDQSHAHHISPRTVKTHENSTCWQFSYTQDCDLWCLVFWELCSLLQIVCVVTQWEMMIWSML